ncbi:MAG: AMP-binding protein [Proteobacteria bacterium]|nr:AMP-binding protein [Pseudomonadota bacterium]MDA0862370.1 AMP-binding protein [Pseudomonadota bacterium]MDA1030542.1 AMP-binding protein [Pseudomonadota bacterium]
MNIANILLKAYRLCPDRPAVSIGSKPLYTYRSFYERVRDLAACMRFELSLSVGDRVAIVMPNHPEYLVVRYAAWYAGLSVVPINAKLHVREINYMLQHSGSKVCFVSSRLQNEIFKNSDLVEVIDVDSASYHDMTNCDTQIEMVEVERDALAWLFYTSGTTGKPKGVMITHENMLVGAMSYLVDVDDISSEDSIVHAAPLSHGSGFYDLPHVMRCANQVIPASGQFNPSEVLGLIQDWTGVTMFLAPTMVKRIVQSQEITQSSLQGLKTVVYGGGPMYVQDIKRALDVLGPRFVQIYGQGESPMTITVLPKKVINDVTHQRYEQRLASVGMAQNSVSVAICNNEGSLAPNGTIGEVLVKGSVVASGYWQDEVATKTTWKNGWLHTGDIGFFDDDGFLTLIDRSKDLIISGGSNIYPREIEEVLMTHPSVHEAACVGQFSDEWGESVVAFVVLDSESSTDARDLDAFCLDRIARFKRPKYYRFVDSLPKNNYGKVLKTTLRQLLT